MHFTQKAQAFWLIDDIAGNMLEIKEPFVTVIAKGGNNEANVRYEDGNYNLLKEVHYSYSDLPDGEWKFFITDNVIMLPSEY